MPRQSIHDDAAAYRRLPAALLLALLITVAGCGQKKAAVAAVPKADAVAEAEEAPPAPQASAPAGSGFLPNPRATIDQVKQKLDAAAAAEQKRRDAID